MKTVAASPLEEAEEIADKMAEVFETMKPVVSRGGSVSYGKVTNQLAHYAVARQISPEQASKMGFFRLDNLQSQKMLERHLCTLILEGIPFCFRDRVKTPEGYDEVYIYVQPSRSLRQKRQKKKKGRK